MASTPGPSHLSGNHRDTLLQIFQHPAGYNVEWRAALSLLEAVGSVEQQHDGKFRVQLGEETEVFARPQGKDVDVQQVVDLRRMLTNAGYAAVAAQLEDAGKEV